LARGDLTAAIVKVTVKLTADQVFNEGEIAPALTQAWHAAPVVLDVERAARLRLGDDVAAVAALTPEQAFEKWLTLQPGIAAARQERLREMAGALMRAVDQTQGG
jgi:hypothetical protein